MSRSIVLVLFTSFLMLLPAAAWGEKDPFEPLVTPEGRVVGPAPAPRPGAPPAGTVPGPALPSVGGAPSIPRTGIEATLWVGIAAILILAGVAFLQADRYRRLA